MPKKPMKYVFFHWPSFHAFFILCRGFFFVAFTFFSSFLQHNANYVVKETKMKSKKYATPKMESLAVQTENVLADSNEGDWMPLNIVIPDDSSVK